MTQVSMTALVSGICSGEFLASFPTDTVPALAVRPDRAASIFAAKQRSPKKPLILMGARAADLWPFAAGGASEQHEWQQMATRYWPGALTLVLPASDRVPAAVHLADPTTIGLRVPACAIAQAILAKTGPLATTSANRSGQPPLQDMAKIAAQFPNVLTLATDAPVLASDLTPPPPAQSPSGLPSTVIKWTGDAWDILRQGNIKLSI